MEGPKKVNVKVTEWREVEHDVSPHSKAFFRRKPHSVTFFDIECCEELVHIVDQIASKVAWRMRVRGPVSSKNNKNKRGKKKINEKKERSQLPHWKQSKRKRNSQSLNPALLLNIDFPYRSPTFEGNSYASAAHLV